MQNTKKNIDAQKSSKTKEEAKILLQMKSEVRGAELVKW
jgi:hypothetical protein